MGRKITKLGLARNRISYLNDEIKRLEREKQEIVNDLAKHRNFFLQEMRRQINCIGANQCYSAKVMVERLAQHLGSVKPWHWG